MRLLYSEPSKVPYIEFDKDNKLIFSVSTEDFLKGFKYLCFSGRKYSRIRIGQRIMNISEPTNFVTDMKFTGIPKALKTKKGPLSPITFGVLKKMFKELVPDGYFHRDNLPKLTKMLDRLESCEEDYVDDDPTANGDEEK